MRARERWPARQSSSRRGVSISSRSARTSSSGRAGRVGQVPVHVPLPGEHGHASPQPIVTTTSAHSTSSLRDPCGRAVAEMSTPNLAASPRPPRGAPRRSGREPAERALRRRVARTAPAPSASGRRSPMQTKYARGRPLTQRSLGRAAERERELLDRLGHEPVVDPRSALPRDLDQAGLAQDLQVVRDRRLGEPSVPMRSQTQTSSAPASRLTIATRLGSASALNRAASSLADALVERRRARAAARSAAGPSAT